MDFHGVQSVNAVASRHPERFSARTCSFFSLIKEAVLKRVERISPSNMQLLFLSGSKRSFYSEVERFFSLEHAAFSLWIEEVVLSEVERFSCSNLQLFFSEIEETVLSEVKRFFLPRTCSCFFL